MVLVSGSTESTLMQDLDAANCELLQRDIARVLVPRDEIARRIDELASEISDCYRSEAGPDGEAELTILAVLTGSLMFISDLIRRLPLKIRIDVMSASSYRGETTTPQDLVLRMAPEEHLTGKHVLVVDDILDTGTTLGSIVKEISARGPLSVRTCVLLHKVCGDIPCELVPDFYGFALPGEFVVGYGLDFDNLYRNLPDICVLQPHVLERGGRKFPDGGEAEG